MKFLRVFGLLFLTSCITPASEFLINGLPPSQIEHQGFGYELDGINIIKAQISFLVKNVAAEPIKFDQREFMLVDGTGRQNYALDAMERLMGCAQRREPICVAPEEQMPTLIKPGEQVKKTLRFRDQPLNFPFVLYRLDQMIMEIKRKPE